MINSDKDWWFWEIFSFSLNIEWYITFLSTWGVLETGDPQNRGVPTVPILSYGLSWMIGGVLPGTLEIAIFKLFTTNDDFPASECFRGYHRGDQIFATYQVMRFALCFGKKQWHLLLYPMHWATITFEFFHVLSLSTAISSQFRTGISNLYKLRTCGQTVLHSSSIHIIQFNVFNPNQFHVANPTFIDNH